MAFELFADEKVLYTKDFCKGRSRSKGTVTVTDRRLISSVESKKGDECTAFRIEEVSGVNIKFNGIGLVMFIVGGILAIFYWLYGYVIYPALWPSTITISGKFNIFLFDAYAYFGVIRPLFQLIYKIITVACFIIGIMKIRNGFGITVFTPNSYNGLINVNATSGKIKPLLLKTDRESAEEILKNLSVMIAEAKAKPKK